MLKDQFGRTHDYLRISITDNCNFRCLYCMPDEKIDFLRQNHLMSSDEIFSIAKIFTDLGVNKIRLTGGEPLMRKDFGEILFKISLLPAKLGLTTNGLLIDRYLEDFKPAGLTGINISLDSLNKEKFKSITQRDNFDRVWQNILSCVDADMHVKINMVLMKGTNEDEIFDFVNLTKELPVHIRFIEYMPFDKNGWHSEKVLEGDKVLKSIEENYSIFKLTDRKNDTDRKFGIFGHAGTIAFISTLTHSFCGGCNRLRLTADGKMKNCLFGLEEFDLLGTLRSGQDLRPVIENGVFRKHKKLGGQFDDYKTIDPQTIKNRSMIKIGG